MLLLLLTLLLLFLMLSFLPLLFLLLLLLCKCFHNFIIYVVFVIMHQRKRNLRKEILLFYKQYFLNKFNFQLNSICQYINKYMYNVLPNNVSKHYICLHNLVFFKMYDITSIYIYYVVIFCILKHMSNAIPMLMIIYNK